MMIDTFSFIITFASELILKSLKRLLRSPTANVDNVYLLYTHTHTRAHTHRGVFTCTLLHCAIIFRPDDREQSSRKQLSFSRQSLLFLNLAWSCRAPVAATISSKLTLENHKAKLCVYPCAFSRKYIA